MKKVSLANPTRFKKLILRLQPYLLVMTVALFSLGLYYALWNSPIDYQQGETVRIMYIHVPAAWMALQVYAVMAIGSFCYVIWGHKTAQLSVRASAKIGCLFTLICLVTGSIWGKVIWGAWWVWDARLTSVLILFLLYWGYILLDQSLRHTDPNTKIPSYLVILGVINLPIIKWSVDWWNTIHQPASLTKLSSPSIHPDMLVPLLLMGVAYFCLYGYLFCLQFRYALAKEKQSFVRG